MTLTFDLQQILLISLFPADGKESVVAKKVKISVIIEVLKR